MKISKEDRISQLLGLLDRTKEDLKIEAGELNCDIYNDSRIADGLRAAAGRIRIAVQSSPVICVDEVGRNNTVLELWKDGKVELFIRKVRGDRIHRWVGDGTMIYSEDFHEPLASSEEREVMELKDPELWASRAAENFIGRIIDKEVTLANQGNTLLLTPSDILAACEYFEKKGEDYNFKTKEEIEQVLQHLC